MQHKMRKLQPVLPTGLKRIIIRNLFKDGPLPVGHDPTGYPQDLPDDIIIMDFDVG